MSLLKVAIIGANGKVGRLLINRLKAYPSKFDIPLAIVRTKEQKEYFEQEVGVKASLTSIEDCTVDELTVAIKGYDAVVFSAGAGGRGIERIFTVDLEGCRKAMEACEKIHISRFLVVSAVKADVRSFWWNTGLRNYYIAKSAADEITKNSKLDFTILQPGWLGTDKGTGRFQPLDRFEEKSPNNYAIEREDVAEALEYSILNPKLTARKVIPLANGDKPIDFVFKHM
ncbi:hypothetical protein TBLA_0I00210 [Henningerozyma blattae CBS 6284]|uniref:NAD(P)-binding domain-containing protein n=1 Tax=Henningerozyma blattae (strain ATCC 34711 / CBS 6284 / DSM 70876 / NBRC 10599 / NRRL Y-10934 / UCD 77-7) TaxID=1071380 RepID=I2H8I4_HENB6|nr:hypothetical protein TBLA_0I00210 [Tetrapisispora blattae CBS 6284]CCH62686.1 hypothetical protein TBLA_0I00210 [Tetrapisispora blattae CBS 6284]